MMTSDTLARLAAKDLLVRNNGSGVLNWTMGEWEENVWHWYAYFLQDMKNIRAVYQEVL